MVVVEQAGERYFERSVLFVAEYPSEEVVKVWRQGMASQCC